MKRNVKVQSTWIVYNGQLTFTSHGTQLVNLAQDQENALNVGSTGARRIYGHLSCLATNRLQAFPATMLRHGLMMVQSGNTNVQMSELQADSEWMRWDEYPLMSLQTPISDDDYYLNFFFDWTPRYEAVQKDQSLSMAFACMPYGLADFQFANLAVSYSFRVLWF